MGVSEDLKIRTTVLVEFLVRDLLDETLTDKKDLEYALRNPEALSRRLRRCLNVDRQAAERAGHK